MQRDQGEEYPVDEIERKRGNDPEKEIEEYGYHEFQSPVFNTDTLKRSRAGFGSRASLSSKKTLDEDENVSVDGMYLALVHTVRMVVALLALMIHTALGNDHRES